MANVMQAALIVVANRKGAKVFEKRGRSKNIKMIETFDHPEGRLKDHELVSDKFGLSRDSIPEGGHATEPEQLPHDRVAANFANTIVDALERHRQRGRINGVVLVAEPKFLGMLRAAVGHRGHVHIQSTVESNWYDLPDDELKRRIVELELV